MDRIKILYIKQNQGAGISMRMRIKRLTLPVIEKLSRTKFWSKLNEMRRFDVESDDNRAFSQNEKLRAVVTHAANTTGLWNQRIPDPDSLFDENSLVDANLWLGVKTMSKDDARSGFPARVTSQEADDSWRYGSSAGTVDRITVVSDFEKRDFIRATNFRVIDKLIGDPFEANISEIPPDACNVVCALRDEGPLDLAPYVFWAFKKRILFKRETRPDLRGRIERSFFLKQDTIEPIDPRSWDEMVGQLDRQLDRIVDCHPNIIRGLPLFLLWLGERARERKIKIASLKAIMPYGGLLSNAMAKRVSESFGAPFIDFYGTSEFGGIALEENGKSGLNVFADLMFVEVLDEQGQPLRPGKIGKIVVTDFNNRAMPLIRYEVGDYGRWLSNDLESDDQLSLNRNARLEVMGRRVETTITPSGRLVTGREVMDILFADNAILNASLEGRQSVAGGEARYTLRIMKRAKVRPETVTQIQELLELSSPPRIREVGYLRPEKSGKYQVFKPPIAGPNASMATEVVAEG